MRELDLRVQFCLAHMIRDMKYLTTLSDKRRKPTASDYSVQFVKCFRTLHRRDDSWIER